jgi:mRNA-degrading endonuclease RelE of RelBE toxin-antitoxin system
MSWYRYLYRLRIWKYRIIFSNNIEVEILRIDKRWDVYKWL